MIDFSPSRGARYRVNVDRADENSCHAMALAMIGPDQDVLEVGCAIGYLSASLRDQNCRVVGIERDADAAAEARQYCDEVVIADVETLDLDAVLAGKRFDVVLFGDVLEHLRDPLAVLRKSRDVLAPHGSVVASIPNIAHGAVRLALLKGRFDYASHGLLDVTHLRFFTRASIVELFSEAGFVITDLRRTMVDLFETEIPLDPADYSPSLLGDLRWDPEVLTYQFVLKAVPEDGTGTVAIPVPHDPAAEMAELRLDLAKTKKSLARMREYVERLERRPTVVAYELGARAFRTIRARRRARRSDR